MTDAAARLTYCFDVDGTLCTNTYGEYEKAEPLAEMISQINALRAHGHRIILFTARGTTTGINWRQTTERQLEVWGVSYDELLFGKPQADIYIDDRGMSLAEWEDKRPVVTRAPKR